MSQNSPGSVIFVVLRKGSEDHRVEFLIDEAEVTEAEITRRFRETREQGWKVVFFKQMPDDVGTRVLATLVSLTNADKKSPHDSVERALTKLIQTAFEAGREDMYQEPRPR